MKKAVVGVVAIILVIPLLVVILFQRKNYGLPLAIRNFLLYI